MVAVPGKLTVTVIEAAIMHNTEALTSMSPYCEVKLDTQIQKTKVASKEGRTPKWNYRMDFASGGQQYIEIKLMDKDMSYDDIIGTANFYLGDVYKNKEVTEDITLAYKGSNAGSIKIRFEFQPENDQTLPSGNPYQHSINPLMNHMYAGVQKNYVDRIEAA